MKITFGQYPNALPDGMLCAINFPVLALLDKPTGDHRMLTSSGAKSRDLPLSIRTQPVSASGHDGAVPSGAIYEVTVDPETGVFSGRGFLIDDEMGRKTAVYVATHTMDKNSVDVADVSARFVEDMETGDYWIEFTKWSLSATTIVATPAFAEAHAEILASLITDPMAELTASFANPPEFHIVSDGIVEVEVVADGSTKVPFDVFYVPETPVPQKIIVDENGRVYGHLALWESCHDGVEGSCLRVPRPTDGYASFNKPGVLTDRGIVQTGPIFAMGGHVKIGSAEAAQVYGGIENSWCDVRIVEGRLGPWVSGIVRPGVVEETIYAARASRISGHWVGGRLKAIVSVNSEGFDVPGDASDLELDLVAGFAFSVTDEGVSELVASFPPCISGEPSVPDMQVVYDSTGTAIGTFTSTVATFTLGIGETMTAVESDLGLVDHFDDDMLAALLLDETDDVDTR